MLLQVQTEPHAAETVVTGKALRPYCCYTLGDLQGALRTPVLATNIIMLEFVKKKISFLFFNPVLIKHQLTEHPC